MVSRLLWGEGARDTMWGSPDREEGKEEIDIILLDSMHILIDRFELLYLWLMIRDGRYEIAMKLKPRSSGLASTVVDIPAS